MVEEMNRFAGARSLRAPTASVPGGYAYIMVLSRTDIGFHQFLNHDRTLAEASGGP